MSTRLTNSDINFKIHKGAMVRVYKSSWENKGKRIIYKEKMPGIDPKPTNWGAASWIKRQAAAENTRSIPAMDKEESNYLVK